MGTYDSRIPISYRRATREPLATSKVAPSTLNPNIDAEKVVHHVEIETHGVKQTATTITSSPRTDAIGYTLPVPYHPGDSVQNRVTRYLRWFDKEISDAAFIIDEINAELPNWVNAPNLPLTPAQSTAVIYDDVISIILPLFDRILLSYEKQVTLQSKSGDNDTHDITEGYTDANVKGKSPAELEAALEGIHDLRERIAKLLAEKRGEFLTNLDSN